MKSLVKPILLALWLPLFTLCKMNTGQTGDIKTIFITDDNIIETGEIIDNIEFITINSGRHDLLLGNIDDLVISDEYIILVEKWLNQQVTVLDRSGNYITTVDRKGRGPQEYISISHVCLNAEGDIVIYDNFGGKIVIYDIQGNFIDSFPVDFFFSAMEYIDSNNIVCATYGLGREDAALRNTRFEKDLILFTDNSFDIRAGALPNEYTDQNVSWATPHLIKSNHEIYINPNYSDLIYSVKERSLLEPAYKLDLTKVGGISSLPPDFTEVKLAGLGEQHALFHGDFAISDQHVLFNISFPPDQAISTYTFLKSEEKLYKLTYDTTDPGYFFSMSLSLAMKCYDNTFFAVIPPYQINMSLPEEMKNAIPGFGDLSDDSNPVIFVYTLKKEINKGQ